MNFESLLMTPYSWIFLSALFFGYTASKKMRFKSTRKESDTKKRKNRYSFSWPLISGAVFLLCALFIPPWTSISEGVLWLFFFVSLVVFFFIFRFKKEVGIPFVILAIGAVAILLLFLQSITAFTGETEIARIKVLRVKENTMKFEFTPAGGTPQIMEMTGTHLGPEVDIVVFDDLLVFLGAKTWYRLKGLKSAARNKNDGMSEETGRRALGETSGISETLYTFFEENEASIPGIKTVETDISLKRVKELTSYALRIQNDGGIQIVPVE
jgi:hypothetical protein